MVHNVSAAAAQGLRVDIGILRLADQHFVADGAHGAEIAVIPEGNRAAGKPPLADVAIFAYTRPDLVDRSVEIPFRTS